MSIRGHIITALFVASALPCPIAAQRDFCVMEWNVENFFDAVNDSLTQDDAFLPDATRRWNWKRFYRKVGNISKTIAAVGGEVLPDIVALCEVENDTVLTKLTRTGPLRRGAYDYFISSSNDVRGINVALLYRRLSFVPILHRSIRPDFSGLPAKRSRDVLYVSGKTVTGDTLDVFVCHLPSKLDRRKEGRPFRESVARQLRHMSDSLCLIRRRPNIIITGDFNDAPASSAIAQCLKAAAPDYHSGSIPANALFALINKRSGTHTVKGTYNYKGKWETLDNIIINSVMLSAQNPMSLESCGIFNAPFLLSHKNGNTAPMRTYNGVKYQGGFSDHLPTYARFKLNF